MNPVKLTITEGLTANNVNIYREELDTIITRSPEFQEMILDFAKTENIDSVGVTFVISVFKRMKELDKHFKVIGASQDVKSLFKLVKLDQFIDMTD